MASDEWTTMPLDEAVQINPRVLLERGEVYPFVDMKAVDPASRSVGPSEMREFKGGGSRFMNGDTLMARITPCLENGKMARFAAPDNQLMGHGSTEFIVIRGKPDVTDNDFAYYLTRWDGVRQYAISQMTGSSGRQRVPTNALTHLEVDLPPLPEQRAIACILGALDDKIELNRRMNETLEAMARAIFKSWFVDFLPVRAKQRARTQTGDPVRAKADLPAASRDAAQAGGQQSPLSAVPGTAQAGGLAPHIADLFPDAFEESDLGEIPEGWRVTPLAEMVELISGGTPKRSESRYWSGDIPWFSVRDVPLESDIFVLCTQEHITQAGVDNSAAKVLPEGTTIITARGTVGKVALAGVPMAMNQSCYGVRGRDGYGYCFNYFNLRRMVATLQQRTHGSVFD